LNYSWIQISMYCHWDEELQRYTIEMHVWVCNQHISGATWCCNVWYRIPVDDWECLGENTLQKFMESARCDDNYLCANWPDEVTIVPADCPPPPPQV